jgi:ribosomal protein S18 acetylase RimI-like enzyme
MTLVVRPLQLWDVAEACALLNEIILIGGSTAFETPFSEALFRQSYLSGADKICCHVAVDTQARVAGFQWLGTHDKLPDTCADIATFARRSDPVRGVGRALFDATKAFARQAGFAQINATIRADNDQGLRYYTKMGFVDFSVTPAVPLKDGRPVDRISKRCDLSVG